MQAAVAAHPQRAVSALEDRPHRFGGQARPIARPVPEVTEAPAGVEQVEAAFVGAHPQPARAVDEQAAHAVVAEAGRIVRVVPETRAPAGGGIEKVEAAAVRSDPQPPVRGLGQAGDAIVAQALGPGRVMGEGAEAAVAAVVEIEAAAVGPDPQPPLPIAEQDADPIVRQRAGIGRIVSEAGESPRLRVQAVQATAVGADPELAVVVLEDRPHPVLGERIRDRRVVAVDGQGGAVVSMQPLLRPEPEIAAAILGDGVDRPLGQALALGQAVERDVARLGRSQHGLGDEQTPDEEREDRAAPRPGPGRAGSLRWDPHHRSRLLLRSARPARFRLAPVSTAPPSEASLCRVAQFLSEPLRSK